MVDQQLRHLSPPYEFFHPVPGEPFTLRVVRWEVGLAQRPISDWPGMVIKPTIRFHVPAAERRGRPAYVDFTNRGLIQRVSFIYEQLLEDLRASGRDFDVVRALGVLPEAEEPLTLKLTRHGTGIDTSYEVEVVES